MQNALLTLYPIILLVITFYGAKVAKKGFVSDTFIDLHQANSIQAFACIAIILHHLTQQITVYGMRPKGPITFLNYIGYLFTAIFFFFSGYGLITSLETKPDYLKTFLVRRLPSVLVPFWVINILGVILTALLGREKLSVIDVIFDITGITLINGNGWFIIEIVLLYLVFFVLFSLIKNRNLATALLCIATVLIIVFSFMQGHDPEGGDAHWFRGEWWYNSTITFAFGVLFVRAKERFAGFCNKHYPVMVTVFAALSFLFITANVYAQMFLGYYHEPVHGGVRDAIITLIIQSLSCIVVTTFMLILNMKIAIGNKVLAIISSMSLELFLIHGYFVNLVFGNRKMSDFLRFAAVLASSILATMFVIPVVRFVGKKLTALLSIKRVRNDTLERQIYEKRRKKRLRIFGTAGGIILAAAILYFTVGRSITLKSEYSKECEQLRNADVGDTVLWGHYDTETSMPGKERVSWIVIERNDDSVLLITEKGIDGSYYHQKHIEVTWKDSDIRKIINSADSLGAFSKYEAGDMMPIDGDLVSLLTVEEAESSFAGDKERELLITPAAKARGTNINDMSKHNYWDMSTYKTSWWWLRGEDDVAAITAPIVTVDGVISKDTKNVNKPGGAIRPVIRVRTH